MNGIVLKANLIKLGFEAEVFSHFYGMSSYYSYEAAQTAYNNDKWVILTTGLGQVGYISTDLSSVIKSLELQVKAMLKVTKVVGVYDKDPVNLDAKLIEHAQYKEVLENKLNVLDLSALEIASENNLSIGVCNIENFANFINKKGLGSVIGKDWR